MSNIRMYMVTHKPVDFVPPHRTPIFVGEGENVKEYLADNTLDNISEKNRYYCELTAYYWIWKNDRTSEYVSIEHYRRFFMGKCLLPQFITINELKKCNNTQTVITTAFNRTKLSIREFYEARHYKEDIDLVESKILQSYPEYEETFRRIMGAHAGPMYNMVAMPKHYFDNYCQWLFDILFFVEQNTINMSERTAYQQRAYGFLAERLLNVWIEYNGIKREVRPVYFWDDNRMVGYLKTIKKRFFKSAYDPTGPRG